MKYGLYMLTLLIGCDDHDLVARYKRFPEDDRSSSDRKKHEESFKEVSKRLTLSIDTPYSNVMFCFIEGKAMGTNGKAMVT
jgi:hypothetical protein